MTSFTETSAVLELRRVPMAELQPLAEQLGVTGEWSRHMSSRDASDEEWQEALRHVVREYLQFRPAEGDEQFELCVRNRKFFESAIAWLIVENPQAVRQFKADFDRLLGGVQQLRGDENGRLSPTESSAAWTLDAEFHRLFCEAARCEHFAAIVDNVWEKYRDLGRPQTVEELEKTWAEHAAIVDALKAASHKDRCSLERIYAAIFRHVDNARSRWQRRCMEAAKSEILLGCFNMAIPDERRQAQEAFTTDLPELLHGHFGKWVLYVGKHRRGFFKTQAEPYKLCERLGVSRSSFVVRQVLPVAADPCTVN